MSYVPRRIQTIKKDGKTETISDQEFSALEAPLVLLGEPGAGKTETAHAISEARHGTYVTAFALVSGAPAPLLPHSNPVIDGLDEVQASSAEQPLVAILKRLKDLGVRSFAVTCRATDWASVQNERTIETWFTERLVVGHLQPLSDTEVAAMVSPIEIKGRWHSNLWDAACDQLEDNYARNYRSEGRGIYLVLWFGHVPRFNPPGAREYGKPKDASEMLAAIYARSPKTISEKTKLFVLDLSKPLGINSPGVFLPSCSCRTLSPFSKPHLHCSHLVHLKGAIMRRS